MAGAVEKAYRAIRDGIVSGTYRPGTHLTAQDLATTTGISRTPVREAMRRLHAEGLITFIPHRGAFVAHMDDRDITKIYDLRVALEGYAAEAAAAEAREPDVAELDRLARAMSALVEGGKPQAIDEFARLNDAFHKQIVTMAANPRLEVALASVVEMPLVLRTFRRYGLDEMRRSAAQHLELVAAIRARDGAWARSVMTSHILSGRNALLGAFAAERG
ncbi:MAG: GntR family transcriptional regulator [Phenylobacterium zucineum]|nr:MAG: GntR family transcriptional regulator [Phenylobacterium zucineum]